MSLWPLITLRYGAILPYVTFRLPLMILRMPLRRRYADAAVDMPLSCLLTRLRAIIRHMLRAAAGCCLFAVEGYCCYARCCCHGVMFYHAVACAAAMICRAFAACHAICYICCYAMLRRSDATPAAMLDAR